MLGRPARPMPQALSDAIAQMLRGIVGIREAHLPQCFAPAAMKQPAQILVLVLDEASDRSTVLDAVGHGLAIVLPKDTHLDVWPMSETHGLLSTVRQTKMQIVGKPAPLTERPWWKIF